MGIRKIREMGDPILNKKCRPVEKMSIRTNILIDDLLDTMYDADGVGLAAPQVGVLRRICVVDVGEGPVILINPEIIVSEGSQTGTEGCLSVPGKAGTVTRANHVVVKALDREMNEFEVEGEELFARALQHEIDHLDGHLYTEIVEGPLQDVTYDEEEVEEEE